MVRPAHQIIQFVIYDFVEDRQELVQWAEKQGDDGLRRYWARKNQVSFDGKPTKIMDPN